MQTATPVDGLEPALEPELPIVDPHHHLWDKPGARYIGSDFAADIAASGHRVTATVFVEGGVSYDTDAPPPLRPLGETRFAEACAIGSGLAGVCAGIVGYVDLRLGSAAAPVIERHMAATSRFRGIRNSAVWDAHAPLRTAIHPVDRGLLLDSGFRAGFATLGPLGLPFDSWAYFTQADELADLADAFPATTIVSNHVGGLIGTGPYAGRQAEVFDTWRAAMRTLAARPNIVMKIGGLAMERAALLPRDAGWLGSDRLAAAWRPYVETCIEAFGPARCMFESNFPVDRPICDYASLWNAFKKLTAGLSGPERDALFRGTATRTYRLA
jgi:L-fuconolactonase